LSEDDKKIFDALQILDDKTLKILVDYYSNVSQKDDVFRSNSRAGSQLIDEEDVPAATKLDDPAYSDSGIGTASNISKTEVSVEDVNEKAAIYAEGAKIYESINDMKNKNILTNIMHTLNSYHNIIYKNRYNIKFKMSANPWKLISENDTKFFNELDIARSKVHSGSGIKFLLSDPKVLMNRSKILSAEKAQEIIIYSMKLVQYLMN